LNTYEIVANGARVRTALNGKPCARLDLPEVPRSGLFAFEVKAGTPTTVRFKELRLELNPKDEVRKGD
jgi:hypothetical protein